MTSSINRRVRVQVLGIWHTGVVIDGFQDDPEQGFLYDIKLDQPDQHNRTIVVGRPARRGIGEANFYFIDNQAA